MVTEVQVRTASGLKYAYKVSDGTAMALLLMPDGKGRLDVPIFVDKRTRLRVWAERQEVKDCLGKAIGPGMADFAGGVVVGSSKKLSLSNRYD